MESKPRYYAYRQGQDLPRLSFAEVQRLIGAVLEDCEHNGWFQKKLGKDCVDEQRDIGAIVLEKLGRELWPLSGHALGEPEPWLYTIVEFAYDHVSKPIETWFHDNYACGLHVLRSDDEVGRFEFQSRINGILSRSEPAYVLRDDGEIWESTPSGLDALVPPPSTDSLQARVESAIRSFRRYGSTDDDKRHAIHDLADVLEYLKKSSGTGLPGKDESYLFDIANNFGIRHHNPTQKTDYDSGLWLRWIFYAFLNAVDLALRLKGGNSPT
jgi:hypothetical protein